MNACPELAPNFGASNRPPRSQALFEQSVGMGDGEADGLAVLTERDLGAAGDRDVAGNALERLRRFRRQVERCDGGGGQDREPSRPAGPKGPSLEEGRAVGSPADLDECRPWA